MTSRDGRTFLRYTDPVIPRSAPQDRDHNRSNYMAWGMFPLPDRPEEISVYATENYYAATPGRVRRFVYRVDGFVALRGGVRGGQLTTKLVRFTGRQLLLNYVVRTGGTLIVEVLDESGQVLGRSKRMDGEAIDTPVDWEHVPDLTPAVLRLRFTLKNADLFSFRFD
jgi:hypothetical protein